MPYRLRNMSEEQMLVWLETQYDLNENGCWVWRGDTDKFGHGRIKWKRKPALLHRQYWILSGREIPEGLHICHAVGCAKACYNPDHLRADTRSANMLDKHADGTMPCKLTADQVLAIRADSRLHREIAVDYGVHTRTISQIKSGKRWSWVI